MHIEQKYIQVLNDLNTEKAEKADLLNQLQQVRIQFEELELTNNNLIAATWRERDLKKKLTDTIGELNKTKLIVENQHKKITDSITYASNIQLAINPGENDLQHLFPESFMLYLPKDLISGDFPWLYKHGNYIYLAAVDCTGHGVPGAMMSMIGNLLLNDIVNKDEVMLPSQILNQLHQAVVQTLKQDTQGSNSNDGMDVALCRINQVTGEVLYSGAHRPLFLYKNGQVESYSGDKFPIGGMHYKGTNQFTDQVIDCEKGDSLFLFTDGFPDQIGGSAGKKIMTRNFKHFLETTDNKDISKTKTILVDFYTEWKGEYKQVDDILIIGIKF